MASMHGERPEGGWRGYAGTAVERRWSDIFTVDVFLTETRPARVIELGTGTGGFSSYLANYAYLSDIEFHTFDSHLKASVTKRPNYRALRLISALGGLVYHRDIFSPATIALIRRLGQRPGPTFLYCDNGDKVREAHLFAPALKTGDYVAVHDFNSEVHPADLADLVDGGLIEPWFPAFFESLSSSNRIYRRTARPAGDLP